MAWLGSARQIAWAWLGFWLELASARLYYTAPYRFGIDVSCTCPLVHWLGLGWLGSVWPRLKINYASSAPYDTTTNIIISSAT